MSLGRKLSRAIVNLLVSDQHVNAAQSEAVRRVAEHNRAVARANFEKAEKRVKRARRHKQLRDLGLSN